MRMFLVGMCDIFLLLYLTALAEVDSRRMSDLTVKDYVALKQSEEGLKSKAEMNRRLVADKQRDAEVAIARARMLEAELRKAKGESKEVTRAAEQKAEELKARLDIAVLDAQREKAETQKALDQKAAELQRIKEAEEQGRELLEEEKKKASEESRKAEDALKEAERQRLAAEEAVRVAAEARSRELQAAERAEVARQEQAKAVTYAQQALSQAENAHGEIAIVRKRADQAAKDQEVAKSELRHVTQSADQAYARNIEPKVETFSLSVLSSGLLGSNTKRFEVRGIPVRIGGESVIFVPLSNLEIEDRDDARAVAGIEIGNAPTRVYVSPERPSIAAFVVRSSAATEPVHSGGPSTLMPTLIAVRNGSRQEFGDRVRNLSDQRFHFSRDRLSSEGGTRLAYVAEGIRGTGDYGERILPGDQIVDLRGQFVGVAPETNVVRRISDLEGWHSIRSTATESVGDELAKGWER